MKSTEITLTNIKNFENTLLSKQTATDARIYHLIACNNLELASYITDPPSLEHIDLLNQIINTCVNDSLERLEDASEASRKSLNLTKNYEDITKDQINNYKDESERFSKFAFWIFIAGVILCFCLVLDLIIFESEE
jgi:hypothetical protein